MLSFLLRQREVFPSFPRRRETRFVLNLWIPALAASAGITFVCVLMKKLTDTMEDHKFLKIRVIMAALLVATLSACMVVGPDYVRPTVITPDAYKENDGWKVAQPKDDLIRGAWWEIFGDPQLNALAAQVSVSNQNLAAAEAQYREAQALDYFQLRELDAQKQLLTATVAAFQKSLELTEGLYAQGVASEADVLQAETQLKTTQAQLINVGVQRAQFEHAIAVLIGKPPS